MSYTSLALSVENHVAHLELNRPEKLNAMNRAFWQEMVDAFAEIDERTDIRSVVISGRGRHFTAGLDLNDFADLFDEPAGRDPGREREKLRRTVLAMQETFSVIERCRVPVLAAVHGACIGGGVDLITACDCRYATTDAFICIQEVNIGITADVGTLQRLPHLMPQGVVRELSYTGRRMPAKQAAAYGLFNETYADRETMLSAVMATAHEIAAKSPLATVGIKEMLNYTRDHTVADSLNYIATWNAAMLLGRDVKEAVSAQLQKRDATFDDLYAASGVVDPRGRRSGAR